ncbi:MAG: hypothetical protein ACFE9Z_02230 [Promethearchaeota archaeon]
MAFDISTTIILITLTIIYTIFLVFDLFGRNEKYGYLAYIVALAPVNFFWAIGGDPVFMYILLFLLWIAAILRDTVGVYRKKEKEINEILLYFALGVLIQLIISAIIPQSIPALQADPVELFWFFWLPNIHSAVVDASLALGFKLLATFLIMLIIVPLILDIKDEEVPLPIVIVFVALFIVPFLYLDYVWIGGTGTPVGLLTFLFAVILFIILLLITRSGQESK